VHVVVGHRVCGDSGRRRLRRIEGLVRRVLKAAGPLLPGAQNGQLGENAG
jgi:hypothetical protein